MSAVRLAVLAVSGVLALTATGVRYGDHSAYFRVVVDFNGKVPARQVELDKLNATSGAIHVAHAGGNATTVKILKGPGTGVRIALQPGTQALHIAVSFARNRFKYVSYAVVNETHLAIDLWKSAPPTKATVTCPGLSIQTWGVQSGVVVVSGKGRGIFENTFEVVVRGANGRVLGRRANVHARPTWPGNWGARVHYKASHRQTGTLEAVALSPKDGSLACLAQVRVTLPAS
jgi:hypothetical protein